MKKWDNELRKFVNEHARGNKYTLISKKNVIATVISGTYGKQDWVFEEWTTGMRLQIGVFSKWTNAVNLVIGENVLVRRNIMRKDGAPDKIYVNQVWVEGKNKSWLEYPPNCKPRPPEAIVKAPSLEELTPRKEPIEPVKAEGPSLDDISDEEWERVRLRDEKLRNEESAEYEEKENNGHTD